MRLAQKSRAAAPDSREREPSVPIAWPAAPALAALVAYLLQAPRVSGDKDASEFTLVLALNGIAHPAAYPLYTLLGHLRARFGGDRAGSRASPGSPVARTRDKTHEIHGLEPRPRSGLEFNRL